MRKTKIKKFDLGFYIPVNDNDFNDVRRHLECLKELDINTFGTDGFCRWHETKFTDAVANIITDMQMTLHSFHSPFGLRFVDSKRLNESVKDNKRIIDIANSWGAKNIVWHTRWFRSTDGDTHAAKPEIMDSLPIREMDILFAEVIPQTCEYAQKFGININLENLPLFKWGRDSNNIIEFIRSMNIPNFGFIFDIGHAWCSGFNPEEIILKVGNLLNDTHFHDNFGLGSYNLNKITTIEDISAIDLHLPPGLGTIKWVDVIKALHQIQYKNPIIFEGPSLKGVPVNDTLKTFKENVSLSINNWRAFELLAEYCPVPDNT